MKNEIRVLMAMLLSVPASPALAGDSGWLIASQSETVTAGHGIALQVIRPSAQTGWPDVLHLRLMLQDGSEIRLPLDPAIAADSDIRRSYVARIGPGLAGMVRAELAEVSSNRLALVVADETLSVAPLPASQAVMLDSADAPGDEEVHQKVVLEDTQFPALSVNEPMYFILGGDADARFQLSFNYRLFSPEGPVVKLAPFLTGLYFGYTQNSFWDLGEDSKPFRDTSYRPSLYWQGSLTGPGWLPQTWKAGYEHESNGKDDEDSRSIDTLFFEPRWEYAFPGGRVLSFNPRIRAYLDKSDNPDIQRYRGFVNWAAQYGRDDGWKFALNYLQGTSGYATAQIDASYPLGTEVFSNIGSFIHFQYFTGYGETLLNYDDRKSDQFRIGISIVR